jgi:signal transduction histidine kinase/NO-binding membrane sensor protein with MHYT domain
MSELLVSLQHYDRRLLVMAMLICLTASAAALSAYARATSSARTRRRAWCLAAGSLLGSGAWASHFIWMAAGMANSLMGFEFLDAALAWLCAVVGFSAGALVAASRPTLARRALGGAVWALTAGVSQLLATIALRLPATLEWRAGPALAGLGLAFVLSIAGLLLAGDGRRRRRGAAAAVLLTLSFVAMHFMAMSGLVMHPAPALYGPTVFSRETLATGVSLVAVLILLNGGGMLAVDRFSKASALQALHNGLDQAPTALGFYDGTHRLAVWNRAYADMMEVYGMRAVAGMRWKDMVGVPIAKGQVDPEILHRAGKHRIGYEEVHFGELLTPDGRCLDARVAPVRDGGFVVVLNDVTELHKLAARETEARKLAEDASRSKSEFLANVSHEIRTPLNAVLGMVQVMGRNRLSKAQRERLNVIDAAGRTLLSTLNDVLDLTKIEAGKLELEPHAFDLEEVVGLTAAAYAPLAAQKDLAFEVRIAPEAAGAWVGDSTRVRQVLSNLISNAVKFTSAGRVELAVTARDGGLAFAVRDTGIGIAPEKLGAIFEKFTQADASMTRRFGGTGLGLAICHQLVGLMGGELEVTSRQGEGACFAFWTPLARGAARAPAAAAARPQAPARPLRILAAEDNPTNQLILTALIEPLGAELTMASDGREAVEAAARQAFDVILMDAQMPVMNGMEAALEIRRREAEAGAARTPIIALTANVMQHQLAEYAQAGMDGHVAKPIEAPKLFEAIAAAVEDGDPAGAEAAA